MSFFILNLPLIRHLENDSPPETTQKQPIRHLFLLKSASKRWKSTILVNGGLMGRQGIYFSACHGIMVINAQFNNFSLSFNSAMKSLSFFLLFSFLSSSVLLAQTQPASTDTTKKNSDCDCNCRDVEFVDCNMKRFESLKVDTVAGRINLFTNLAWSPMSLTEKTSVGATKTRPTTYLTWDFIEGEGALTRRLFWGGQFGMGIPIGGRFHQIDNPKYETVFRPSWYFGTHFTFDLFYARRFKVFAMANLQAAFNNVQINRNQAQEAGSTGTWLGFIQNQATSKSISYDAMLDNMKITTRDRINLWQFTAQVQASLGADILLHPNGASLRLQGGYQLPINPLTSAWRYGYSENIEDGDSRRYQFAINNTPFSYLQEGLFFKVSFNWLINKSQTCRKGIRKDCCDDYYRYNTSPTNNNNNNNGTYTPPRNPTRPRPTIPRTPTPRPTPRTPTPKPIPR